MFRTRSQLAALLAAASVLLGAVPAAAQITLTAAPGLAPVPSFFNRYTAVAYNSFNGLPNGTKQLHFGAIGSGVLDGAAIEGNQVVDLNQDGRFGLTFSRPIGGLFAAFGDNGGPLVLTFLNRGATVGTLSTTLPTGWMAYLGVTELTFDALTVTSHPGGHLRMDELVLGVRGPSPSVSVVATPEPATVALLGFGLAGLGVVVRRRPRSARAA